MKRHWIPLSCATLLLMTMGCSGAAQPAARLTTAEAALRAASEVGAGEVPRASLHVKLAQEQIEEARQLINDGSDEQADLALRRAQADAELAIIVAKEHKTIADAKATAAKYEKLKNETQQQ